MTKATFLFFAVLLLYALSFAGNYHKGPKVGPSHQIDLSNVIQQDHGSMVKRHASSCPGDSIAITTYDYGTNGSALHNLIVYPDSFIVIGRMAQDETGSDARGTYYTCSADYGMNWSTWHRIETARAGWGNIDQLHDFDGVEVSISHANSVVNMSAARCSGVWSEIQVMDYSILWPRLAAGSGSNIHLCGAGDQSFLSYSCLSANPLCTGRVDLREDSDSDAYDIATRRDTVYIASYPQWDGSAGQGADVILYRTSDFGFSWSVEVIYDAPAEGELPEGEEAFLPDGAGCVILDTSGAPHVFWSNYLAIGDANDDPVLFMSVDAPIVHWSEATGITIVAYADPDTTIGTPSGRDGNYASQPDAGIDQSGNLYVIFQRMINEIDPKDRYYEHVFAAASEDGGAHWGQVVDVTPGIGFDAAFSSAADRVDDYVHFVYNCDDTAGNSIQGNHLENQTAVIYHRVDKTTIPFYTVDVDPTATPTAYSLRQNYPNPFNPRTTIRFELPRSDKVSLNVFNLLGEEVTTLITGHRDAGTHTVQWDASGHPSGVYFYRLRAGEFVETRKLVLVR